MRQNLAYHKLQRRAVRLLSQQVKVDLRQHFLKLGWSRTHHSMEGSRKMTLVTKAHGQPDFHQTVRLHAQHFFGPLDPAFQNVLVWCHAHGPLEHA